MISRFILSKNREEHKPRKFKTQKHLSIVHVNTKLNTNKSKIKPLTLHQNIKADNFFFLISNHTATLLAQTLSLSGLEILVWWVWYGLERERLRSIWSGLEGDVETGCCHGMASGGMWVQDQPNGEWFKSYDGQVLGFKVVLVVQQA